MLPAEIATTSSTTSTTTPGTSSTTTTASATAPATKNPTADANLLLPAYVEDFGDIGSFVNVVTKLTECITKAVTNGKSVTANKKRLIALAAEEIRRCGHKLASLPIVPAAVPESSDLKADIVACVRSEMAKFKGQIAAQLQTQTRPASYAHAAAAGNITPLQRSTVAGPVQPPTTTPVTRPAIIVSAVATTKSREEIVKVFKSSVSFRNSGYAPTRIQPVSNHKLRVEFENEKQRDDTLQRLTENKNSIRAEPARGLKPMIILKGISRDVPANELADIIKGQNAELADLMNGENLTLRFKRDNRNDRLYNAVFLTESKLYKKMLDLGRLCIEHQRVYVGGFSPFLQCHKCLQFGHMKAKCTAQESPCAHCASTQHQLDICPNKNKPHSAKCFNCDTHNKRFQTKFDTQHAANSIACPRLRAMKERVLNRVDYGSTP